MGVETTGFDQLETIGGAQDPEVCRSAHEIFAKEFPVHLGYRAEVSEAEDRRLRVTAGEASVVVDRVLAAMGRVPNLDNLGLENLGAKLDERGIPVFDRSTMQVGDLPVFIAGDVTGERPVLHEAGDEGRIAGYNAVHDGIARFQRKVPLFINFCDPNICIVGQRWNDLDPESTAVGEVKLAPVGRALIMGKNKGTIRVYADKASGRLLGAEMVTTKGENLAHLLAWCISQDLTVGELLRMPFYHPVIEEALQAALYDLYAKVDRKNEGGLTELARL
jgi:dihydrolipoamide dehydrogenase